MLIVKEIYKKTDDLEKADWNNDVKVEKCKTDINNLGDFARSVEKKIDDHLTAHADFFKNIGKTIWKIGIAVLTTVITAGVLIWVKLN